MPYGFCRMAFFNRFRMHNIILIRMILNFYPFIPMQRITKKKSSGETLLFPVQQSLYFETLLSIWQSCCDQKTDFCFR